MALLPVLLDMVDEIYDNLDNPSKYNSFADIPLLFLPQRGQEQPGCPRKNRRGCSRGADSEAKKDCQCPYKDQIKENQQATPSECPEKGKCPRSEKCMKEKEKSEKPKEWNALAFYDHPWARRCHPWDMMRHYHQNMCAARPSNDFQAVINVQEYKPEEISVKVKDREIMIEGKHEERQDEHGFVSRQFTRRYTLPDEFDIDSVTSHLTSDGKMIIKAVKPKSMNESGERIIPIERVVSSNEKSDKAGESSTEASTDKENAPAASFEIVDKEKPKK